MTLLLLSLFACEDEDPCELAAEVAPELSFGEGKDAFSPVEAGHGYEPESGSQGGQHIWVGLQASGIHPGGYSLLGDDVPGPRSFLELTSGSGEPRGSARQRDTPWIGNPERAHTFGIRLVLEGVGASELLLTAEIEDACGTQLVEELTIRVDF